jgi:DNA replication and repair protein RecF
MHLRHLALTHFRNYGRQDFDFEPGIVLLLGENAQGKTNVLEAVALLAIGRSERADADADFIAWGERDGPQPYARVEGEAVRAAGDVRVEVVVAGRQGAHGVVASKSFKLNGVARRSSDVIGAMMAVLFTTDDMDLVRGAPSGRRRYLDVMLSQADRAYLRALQRYGKVTTQRNALLKRISEGASQRDELAYWDEQLAADGAVILHARASAVEQLSRAAAAAHARLSGEREQFALAYEPRFSDAWPPARISAASVPDIGAALLEKLNATHARDIGARITLTGPHRDDLGLTLGGEAASSFASRGQQRTAALALRLAEASLLHARSGERPILLLDDVLSELDEGRRNSVLAALDAEQVIITSADADRFAGVMERAQAWRVEAGVATRAAARR